MSLINKVIFRNFKNEIIKSSIKFVSVSSKIFFSKKSGSFEANVTTKDNSKENESKLNVKLYPGFQQSMEDIRFKKNDEEMTAKKVIEDFYGLNEFEYEKEDYLQTEKQLNDEYEEFNIDLIVKVLRNEKIQNVCVIRLPEDINYAEYMVIATCLSEKHLNSAFQTINRRYKNYKKYGDVYFKKKQGKENKWCAMDTGNIVIHLFLPEYREFYNLESLWACGIENDENYLQFKEDKLKLEQRIDFLEVKE